MTSLQRVLTSLSHKEPDRVPLLLGVTLHGAKELGMSIKEYFSKAENVVEGQIRMREKYQHDFLIGFLYGAGEVEAWGGEVIFRDDGPPNSGQPIISKLEGIKELELPKIEDQDFITKSLQTIEMLKSKAGEDTPIVGVVMSPFSMPVMQMGFDKYLELIYERPELFEHLMRLNEEYCVEWANAQLNAGATAIVYFDPVSSPTIIPRGLYLKTGFKIAKRIITRIKGAVVTHFASGRCLPIINDIIQTVTVGIGVSVLEDLAEIKSACKGKITAFGNLNAIEMRHWTYEQAEKTVKDAIAKAGPGGGYVITDNHGEIPWQVPDEVLFAISESVHKWGKYPLDWVNDYGK